MSDSEHDDLPGEVQVLPSTKTILVQHEHILVPKPKWEAMVHALAKLRNERTTLQRNLAKARRGLPVEDEEEKPKKKRRVRNEDSSSGEEQEEEGSRGRGEPRANGRTKAEHKSEDQNRANYRDTTSSRRNESSRSRARGGRRGNGNDSRRRGRGGRGREDSRDQRKNSPPARRERRGGDQRADKDDVVGGASNGEGDAAGGAGDDGVAPGTGGEGEDFQANAVQIINRLTEIYNRPVQANVPVEKKGPEVARKMSEYLQLLDKDVSIKTLQGQEILGNFSAISKRYQCVFTESGTELLMKTHKRFYYEVKPPARSAITLCLDFEEHRNLVSAKAGTHPDGREGLTKPRNQHLIALYVCSNNLVQKVWLGQDKDKISSNPKMGKLQLLAHPTVKPFIDFIGKTYPNHLKGTMVFNSYHDVPVVG
ncbi:unnamed protein product [Amoebophrya sp. A25]|nr:unnamed protein product [Amoebophrya sp. A25]|eukprot:GSA25T00003432001.1